ncbi:MAG: hypothetical protein Q9163_005613 [Psora crenata]
MKMASAESDVTTISKAISDFSLMLKQVARAMEGGRAVATPLAIYTVVDIKNHSERLFEEIKSMTELAQVRDEEGNLTEIGIGQKVASRTKRQKVPYLLGQLEYLRLNLAIMLQILQLGKTLRSTRHVVTPNVSRYLMLICARSRATDKFRMQERAEIQNMIVLQHWSFEELKGLYSAANDETRRNSISPNSDDPPPRYEEPATDEVHLASIAPPRPPKEEVTSKAMVQYREQPLQQLDESLHQALARENSTLSAPVPDIVNHLLHEWTQPNFVDFRASAPRRPLTESRKYMPRISDDEEDTTESEYDESDDHARGYYLEGPRADVARKNVRFRYQKAKVEDGPDEAEHPPNRPSHKHIINSDDYSSDSSQSSPIAYRREPRRDSNSSGSRHELHSYSPSDRNPRPYTSGPSGPRNSPPEKEAVVPGSFQGRPPLGLHPRTMPVHMRNQPWQGHGPNSPGLRPPQPFSGQPGLPQRRSSGGVYIPQPYVHSPSTSPVAVHGGYFPPRQPGPGLPPSGQGPPPGMIQSRPSRPRTNHGSRQAIEKAERDKKSASRNIKKGIGIGAAAAGLMELLSGLDGI